MAQRVQKTRSRNDFRRDEQLASETLMESRRRNVAPEAYDTEPEEYTTEDLVEQGETPGDKIKTGAYEDDYGPGAEGLRGSGMRSKRAPLQDTLPPKRGVRTGLPEKEDVPTGAWARQRTKAKIKKIKPGAKGTPKRRTPARRRSSKRS